MEAFPIQGTLKYTGHFSKLLSFLCLSEQIAQFSMPKQFGPEKTRDKVAMRSVLAPAPHPEPTSRLNSVTREDSFCAMALNGDET